MKTLFHFLTLRICVQRWTKFTIDGKWYGLGVHVSSRATTHQVWFIPLTPRLPRKLDDPW